MEKGRVAVCASDGSAVERHKFVPLDKHRKACCRTVARPDLGLENPATGFSMPTRLRTGGAADAPRRIDTTQDHAAASKYALSHSKPLDLLKKPKAHFDAHQIYRWWGRAVTLSPVA